MVGGTHGNEYTGVWCIKAIKKHLQQNDKESLFQTKYPSLDISTLLANPQAHLENKRFVDSDLNREFPLKKLFHDNTDDEDMSVEEQLAQEINSLLGPKLEDTGSEQTDVVVDLHTTTANMGITVIVPEGDSLMAQAAAYVIAKCQEEKEQIKNVMNGQNGNDSQSVVSCRCLMHSIPDKNLRPNLSSTGKHGFTIEVGPVPQGVLRHDAVENTQRALHYLLEFLHKRNENEGQVSQELKTLYPEGKVPCFLSAPAKRSGEISGKITWPCDDENPNFPTLIIHKNIQDKDFQIIRKGDPLFVRWDGSTINYNGSHGVSAIKDYFLLSLSFEP